MIALDLDDAVLHSASGATSLFELFAKFLQPLMIQGDPGDHGHALPLATFSFSSDPHRSVAFWHAGLLEARAVGAGFAASGTHPAMLGRVDRANIVILSFCHVNLIGTSDDFLTSLEQARVVHSGKAETVPAVHGKASVRRVWLGHEKGIAAMQGTQRPGQSGAAPAGREAPRPDFIDIRSETLLVIQRRRVAFQGEQQFRPLRPRHTGRFNGKQLARASRPQQLPSSARFQNQLSGAPLAVVDERAQRDAVHDQSGGQAGAASSRQHPGFVLVLALPASCFDLRER
jgi:hypothetical protein